MVARSRHLQVAVGLVLASLFATTALAGTAVYVSNSIDGTIDVYAMDPASGALSTRGKTPAAKVVMPMAVSPDKRHLYAVVRSAPTRVLTYRIDAASGALEKVAEAPLPESMPYVSTDRTGRFLLTASYAGNNVAVSPVDADGRVTRGAIQVVPTGQNAHAIRPDQTNRFVFATNLGSDQILQFRFDAATGSLTPNEPPAAKTPPGEGPRHLVFSPDNRFVYVLHELTGMVAQFALDSTKGTLSPVGSIDSVPPESGLARGTIQPAITAATLAARTQEAAPAKPTKPPIAAADIRMTPDGRFLFTTERTSSKIALFTIDAATGRPTYVANFATVAQPRGINVDASGKYLVASGEKSDVVAVYAIARETGRLAEVGRYPGGAGANWVEIVDLP